MIADIILWLAFAYGIGLILYVLFDMAREWWN